MTLSPIALFVYNRADHTQRTIEALLKNKEAAKSDLYIFSDAPKNEQQAKAVEEVRKYIRKVVGFAGVYIIEQKSNKGLSASIIQGVSHVVNKYGTVIVLEDDLVVSPFFLDYMNRALHYYESNENVASIHGYVYPFEKDRAPLFFLKGADCWGWATWKRAWDIFETDGNKLLRAFTESELINEFDFDGTYPYYRMLVDQVNGLNQSWAIRWYASCFLAGKLTLYPGKSLVFNIGLDNSGTHCEDTDSYNTEVSLLPVGNIDIEVKVDEEARESFKTFFIRTKDPEIKVSLVSKVLNKIKSVLK